MFYNQEWQAYFDRSFQEMKERVADVRNTPSKYGLIPGEKHHIWKRLEELESMTRDDWCTELKAEYLLAIRRDCIRKMTEKEWNSLDRRCEIFREHLQKEK